MSVTLHFLSHEILERPYQFNSRAFELGLVVVIETRVIHDPLDGSIDVTLTESPLLKQFFL